MGRAWSEAGGREVRAEAGDREGGGARRAGAGDGRGRRRGRIEGLAGPSERRLVERRICLARGLPVGRSLARRGATWSRGRVDRRDHPCTNVLPNGDGRGSSEARVRGAASKVWVAVAVEQRDGQIFRGDGRTARAKRHAWPLGSSRAPRGRRAGIGKCLPPSRLSGRTEQRRRRWGAGAGGLITSDEQLVWYVVCMRLPPGS